MYSSGDLAGARSHLNKARVFASLINRHKTGQQKSYEQKRVIDTQNSADISIESLTIMRSVDRYWGSIANWLDSVILSVGREELVKVDDGIDLLLDRGLPPYWDVHHDIVFVSGKNSQPFIDRLVSRGQLQIVLIKEPGEVIEQGISHTVPPSSTQDDTANRILLLTTNRLTPLNGEQLRTLKKVELPNFTHIPTDPVESNMDGFESLVAQIRAEFVLEATQRKFIAQFAEQFVTNLPVLTGMLSVAEIDHVFCERHIMVVSPGPSLTSSLPAISEHRTAFVIVALLGALPLLLEHGVTPDYAIMSDAQDHTSEAIALLPDDMTFWQIPLIVTEYAHRTTFENRFEQYILVPTPDLVGSPISTALHGSRPPLVVGGSVATFAVSLFAQMQVASITLVGQDLSVAPSGQTYALKSLPQTGKNKGEEYLRCKGINGEDLPTVSDYLHFIKEFKNLGSIYGSKTLLLNCTTFGAYLENWKHLPLDSNHPAVLERSEYLIPVDGGPLVLTTSKPEKHSPEILLNAIESELNAQKKVVEVAEALVEKLKAVLGNGSDDGAMIESLESELRIVMQTQGSLIAYYTIPAKLNANASLESVVSLEENLMVSLLYYESVAIGARRLANLLNHAASEVSSIA